ncbi:MAG: exonuclease, partial [Pseudomonadota bacterium]
MFKTAGLRLRFALFFAAIGLGGTVALAVALWFGWQRAGGPVDGYVIAGIFGAGALIGLSAWVGFLFDENVARPILALAADLETRAATSVD